MNLFYSAVYSSGTTINATNKKNMKEGNHTPITTTQVIDFLSFFYHNKLIKIILKNYIPFVLGSVDLLTQ